ncbi:MAG: glycosyltransferase, partial [Gammaproteobacteria bacterium]
FLVFRRDTFESLDGFDEDYAPAYYEESDFCLRLKQRGLKIIYEPRAELTHYEFASTGGMSKATSLQAEHRKILCQKHGETLARQYENTPANILKARTANRLANVLVLDDRVPHPYLGAGYPRCERILGELAAIPVNVTFYPVLTTDDSWEEVYNTLPHSIEVMIGKNRPALPEFLKDRCDFYDYVIVSRAHNMTAFNGAVDKIPEFAHGTTIIYDAEAIIAPRDIMMRELAGENVSATEKEKLIAAELAEARRANAIIAVSEKEAASFLQHGYERVAVLGHTLKITPPKNTFSPRRDILFVGALRDDHSPNVDSLNWFIRRVMPLIHREIPDARLQVVGHRDAPSLMGDIHPSVTFLGHMKSLDEIFESSRLFIAPTRYAAGIPHKVHEAASRGLPSVVTTLLADQLGWQHGQELLAADSAEAFAENCLRLYRDEALWQQLQQNGLQAAARDCSEKIFRKVLHGLIN